MGRKSQGRKKVEMVKIKNDTNLQVTFSKRRAGLFKKASELCTLCGAEVALVVFSPANKVFSFGHPCVRTLIQRFENATLVEPQTDSVTKRIIDAHRDATLKDLIAQLTLVEAELEMEQKKAQELKNMEKEKGEKNWWELPVEELNPEQLDHLERSLEDLKINVAAHTENLLSQTAGSQPLYQGSSSNNKFNSFGNMNNGPYSFNRPPTQIPDMTSYEYKPEFNGATGPQYNPMYRGESSSGYRPEFSSRFMPDQNVPEEEQVYKPVFDQGFGPGNY